MAHIGYIRIDGGGTCIQLKNVALDRCFVEETDSTEAVRPILRACLSSMQSGDTLHVHSLDRLARDIRELRALIDSLTSAGVIIFFHKENLIFKQPESSPSQALLFHVLHTFAEFERTVTYNRSRGTIVTKPRAKRRGRPAKLSPAARKMIFERLADGEKPADLAQEYGVSSSSIFKVRSKLSKKRRS